MKKITSKLVAVLPYLAILLNVLINLSWDIKDHDDGHTLGYHAMGRNETIQRTYGAYDSMCDYLLGFLPVDYEVLYGFMLAATLLAAFAIIFLFKRILTDIFHYPRHIVNIACALFILGIPEYIYLSYSFKSTLISLAFVLWAFYMLLKSIKPGQEKTYLPVFIPALLFGFGASLRWAHLAYGLVIFSAYLFLLYQQNKQLGKAIVRTGITGILFLATTILFTFISGYPPKEFITVFIWAKGYMETTDFQTIAIIADISMYLTPLTLFAFLLAAFHLFRKKNALFYVIAASSLVIYFVIGFSSCFKTLSMLWLFMMLLFCEAVSFIEQSKKPNLLYGIIGIAFFVNWFIGIRIDTPSSNWGPGLETKTEIRDMSVFNKNLNADSRFTFQNVKPGFYDGFALPGAEGYRPLYGHFYALFCGKLEKLDHELNKESDEVLTRARAPRTVIYEDRINPYLLASYLRQGFTTQDPWKNQDTFVKRTFVSGTDTVKEMRVRIPQNLFNLDAFINQVNDCDSIYLMFTFTSAANKFLYQISANHPYSYKKIGPMSAVIWKKEN